MFSSHLNQDGEAMFVFWRAASGSWIFKVQVDPIKPKLTEIFNHRINEDFTIASWGDHLSEPGIRENLWPCLTCPYYYNQYMTVFLVSQKFCTLYCSLILFYAYTMRPEWILPPHYIEAVSGTRCKTHALKSRCSSYRGQNWKLLNQEKFQTCEKKLIMWFFPLIQS